MSHTSIPREKFGCNTYRQFQLAQTSHNSNTAFTGRYLRGCQVRQQHLEQGIYLSSGLVVSLRLCRTKRNLKAGRVTDQPGKPRDIKLQQRLCRASILEDTTETLAGDSLQRHRGRAKSCFGGYQGLIDTESVPPSKPWECSRTMDNTALI